MSKLSEIRAELDGVREEYASVLTELEDLESAIAKEHEEHAHDGVFRWCDRPACRAVRG